VEPLAGAWHCEFAADGTTDGPTCSFSFFFAQFPRRSLWADTLLWCLAALGCNHDYVTTRTTTAEAWLAGRLPDDWFTGPVEIRRDRDEIVIIGTLREPTLPEDADEADREVAVRARTKSFREETRERRIEIARELEHLSGKKVSWGVRVGERELLFTHLAAPVMTRLRQPERAVLDTLVDAGVARSRAEALAWCVRLVGEKSDSWLAELRTAMKGVEEVRKKGPGS
jgi:hypothetical protein